MKKGFTLVELLAVIVIIALTSTIVFPAIGNVIVSSRQDLYDNQMLDILAASEKWATENSNLLDKYHVNDTYIELKLLRFTGYLEPDAIKNPVTKQEMLGCIQIKYDKEVQKYKYAYEEETCNSFATSSSASNGYIIYKYDDSKKEMTKDDTNKTESIGQYLVEKAINENALYAPGQTDTGLYELDDEYVYRGEASNFVQLDDGSNKLARILSISKKDYSIKIISILGFGQIWSNDGKFDFKGSTISQNLIDGTSNIDFNKIVEYDFQSGKVDNQQLSLTALKSILSKKTDSNIDANDKTVTISSNNTVNQRVGTISILDYVNASATSDCQSNFLSESCKNNNYLYTMFGSSNTVWTLNNDGTRVWYIDNGALLLSPSNVNKHIYPVYKLSSDVFVTNKDTATGTEGNPYKIK